MVDADTLFDLLHMEIVSWMHDFKNVSKSEANTQLEQMGFRVGQSLIEKFTKDSPRFRDELDLMKFICKEYWMILYTKQIDNLRTNHQGVYVLNDNNFKLLSKMSTTRQYVTAAPKFIAFPCGLIRGALAGLGVSSLVTAEIQDMPSCKFQVEIQRT